ncbi:MULTISPECIES: zinc ABC transporter substrate-binding protein AztC [unclassified Rhizobium]|uniref:zinc ABC transporter substrate-binding protein AztC n=1 Tax=unclassified Rhizobium TaxID=2613769 RepID=UPI001051DF90|nr:MULTISPECIES: zinc ABC transporter substrate-binding protein AztC [unclassified Rhizobium]MBB3399342.1 zinc/manganese transport system substrate-binding protein [Rhizobium sp. BK060]MBB4166623.1 zinc/manganese transport system substrate-binding protein [Rhizobium sp. BK538]TCM67629.1 zinc/manganese transport system substrate-binding protein [Rhizobium sp. BK068]
MFRTLRLASYASAIVLGGIASSASAAELKVVASFSIIADLARNVGGGKIEIKTLVPVDGDAHTYEPSPADAASLESANVVLVNGLGLEGFMSRLIETSGTKAPVIEVSKGVSPLKGEEEEHEHADGTHAKAGHDAEEEGHHHHGEFDPHAWQSVANGEIYVKNIAEALCAADKADCSTFTANADTYLAKLKALDKEVRDEIASIPEAKRTIITSHDAFGYFAHEYGLKFLAPQGVSTEAEASAADVAKIIDQVREDKASAVFVENITNPRLMEQVASETGLKVGGTLFSDALSGPDGPASTYIDMFHHNVKTMKAAILGS